MTRRTASFGARTAGFGGLTGALGFGAGLGDARLGSAAAGLADADAGAIGLAADDAGAGPASLPLAALSALQSRGKQPIWYALALVAISPIGVLAGGLVRLRVVGIL